MTHEARAFVPLGLLARLETQAPVASLFGSVLLADLSDFTGLTEALTRRADADGAEQVGREINQAMAPVIDAVTSAGGEVVKFAGDGLLCVFVATDQQGHQRAAERAAARVAAVVVIGPAGTQHRFRVAVVHGPLQLVQLGGHAGRLELVASGPAVAAAQLKVAQTLPGSVAPVLLLAPDRAGPAKAGPAPDESSVRALDYLPTYVRARLSSHAAEWLQEMRTLTLCFVGLQADVDAALGAARVLQAVVDGHGGQLLRLGIEGSQLVAELAFGLAVGPAAAGPVDALSCARRLSEELPGAQVGLSTGRVLLGPVGTAVRRQLTTLGQAVILAARLMQQAAPGSVLVDATTHAALGPRFEGEQLHLQLKGMGECEAWRLAGWADAAAAPPAPLRGRDDELQALRRWLDGAAARPVLIRGAAGLGKSSLCRHLADELAGRGLRGWVTQATPVGRDTPYAGLQSVLAPWCGLGATVEPVTRLREVANQVLGDADRAPLLADALGVAMPDTPHTRALRGPVRAAHIRDALMALFAARQADSAVLVDDAHWLDSASGTLLQRVVAELPALRLVVVSRALPGQEPAALAGIVAGPTLVLDLAPLAPEPVAALVAARLGVLAVPAHLARWVVERARGNPFFAEELVATLVARGLLEATDGTLQRVPDEDTLRALPPLATIESALEQRIDALPVDDAIVLKVASVVGLRFQREQLAELAPAGTALDAVLQRLAAAELTQAEGDGRHAFRHRYTQETAYDMLTRARQRDLHRRTAAWYQGHADTTSPKVMGELAHHWYAAQEWAEAVPWLERAGQQALLTGADREAATHFERALTAGAEQPPERRAAWQRQLAQALFGLGEVESVARRARAAVELVNGALPASRAGWLLHIGALALRRLLRIGAPRRGSAVLTEGSRAAGLLAEAAYFRNQPEVMIGAALLAVELAERAPAAAPVSVAFGMVGVVAGMARLRATAERLLAHGRALARQAEDPFQEGVAWFYTGMYHACRGRWVDSRHAVDEALARTERLRADTQSGFQLTLAATNALYTSDYAEARGWMRTVHARAERAANVQQIGWSLNVTAVADLHQGRLDDALARSAQAREIFLRERDLVSLIISEGVQCAALARACRFDEALAAAQRAAALVAQAQPTTWGQLEGFAGPCEALLLVRLQPGSRAPLPGDALRTCLASLRRFAWVFPFGRARLAWISALACQARGQRGAALRALRQALTLAQRHGMPFEEMRALELQLVMQGTEPGLQARLQGLRHRLQVVYPAVQGV